MTSEQITMLVGALDELRGSVDRLTAAMQAAPAARPAPAAAPAQAPRAPSSSGGPTNFPNYGRSKGAPIAGATVQDLEYYANGARRSIADQSKARWHDKEKELLAAIEAELARPSAGAAEPGPADFGNAPDNDAPPPGDDDIPF